jgi:NADH-quinone oxidoreductase subunit C
MKGAKMSVLREGELREILERELPGTLAPSTEHVKTNGHSDATAQQKVQDIAADTMGATVPAPSDADSAAATQPTPIDQEEPDAPLLFDDDAVVLAERLPDVARFMRDRLGYEYLSHITAVDYPAHGMIEVIYHFYSLEGGPGQMVRVRVPRDESIIPSIAPFWPGANLQEREAWDLYGVQFPGHPYHKRIYMWEEFEGHPMRKDFEKVGDAYYHFQWKGEGGEE